MAFDFTKLEGYREDMTADEKLALLDKYEMPSPKLDGYVPKAQFDKTSSDLAALKKQLRDKQTDDEKREADRLAAEEATKSELESLRKEKTLAGYKASYLAQGYDEKLATEAAVAMAEGKTDEMFSVMKKHSENVEKELRAKILKGTPTPPAGDDPNGNEGGAGFAKQLAEFASASDTASQKALNHYLGGKENEV